MNLWIKVFSTNELLLHMIEFLPSNDILKLCLLKLCKIEEIYKIYHKLYLQLRPTLNISLKNIDLLSHLTRRIIEENYKLKYINNGFNSFTLEENCIRKIIFEAVANVTNKIVNVATDTVSTISTDVTSIMSIYYLFYNYNFYSIMSRFISDEIIISPYESALNKTVYYGNEQTLRMALRFKKHNMIIQILTDMKFIAKKNNAFTFFTI